ncbi:stage II sporulation protein D [Siminovitchia sp. 179-K 8D1 HS]|uniref:stage II sporulation protein D n=1 Tax=Siminovitchia sp. 179-K 8D1 HS TaxID=3142385 RepID=UPI0039A13D5C
MKPLKTVLAISILLFAVSFLIPSLLVLPFSSERAGAQLGEEAGSPEVRHDKAQPAAEVAVFRTATNKVEKIQLEEYVEGVVASEMPAEFEEEALKAQALTARTYIVNHLLHSKDDHVPHDADVSDTVNHQVFKNKQELQLLWGKDYDWKMKKIKEAVEATKGEILTYNGKPINASFFSTSNGYTENAEEYWSSPVPYLKSVESPWDAHSPKFQDRKVFGIKEFQQKLNINLENSNDIGTITKRTSGKKVAKVSIAGKTFTGREIREKLGLQSTDFSWERKGDTIIVSTKGYGHGVGMSQYGANGMAKEGKNYEDIVRHYYQGISISSVRQYDKIMASSQ